MGSVKWRVLYKVLMIINVTLNKFFISKIQIMKKYISGLVAQSRICFGLFYISLIWIAIFYLGKKSHCNLRNEWKNFNFDITIADFFNLTYFLLILFSINMHQNMHSMNGSDMNWSFCIWRVLSGWYIVTILQMWQLK